MLGVCFSAGWISYTAGRLMRRFGGSASVQLAGARLIDDPWSSQPQHGGDPGRDGVRRRYRGVLRLHRDAAPGDAGRRRSCQNPGERPATVSSTDDSFYIDTLKLIALAIAIALVIAALGQLVSIVEAIVVAAPGVRALVATGVPRAMLARTAVWQTLAGRRPAGRRSAPSSVSDAMRLFGGTEISQSFSIGDGPDRSPRSLQRSRGRGRRWG